MKKLFILFCVLALVAGSSATAFAAYAQTNANNKIDWYNIIDGVKERDYRSVSSSGHTPFYFSFNGFAAQEGISYEMTLRHAGNSNNDREQWKLYMEGDNSRFLLDDLVYSNDWNGEEWLWVEQVFLVNPGDMITAGDNWSFVLEPGTKKYSVVDLDLATLSAVPVPGGITLLGSGLIMLAGLRKKRKI